MLLCWVVVVVIPCLGDFGRSPNEICCGVTNSYIIGCVNLNVGHTPGLGLRKRSSIAFIVCNSPRALPYTNNLSELCNSVKHRRHWWSHFKKWNDHSNVHFSFQNTSSIFFLLLLFSHYDTLIPEIIIIIIIIII